MEAEIDALFGVEDGGSGSAGGGGDVQKSLAKLEMEGGDPGIIYLFTEYDSETLTLVASDGYKTWAGSVTKQELAAMATNAKLQKEEFVSTSLKALTRKDMSSLDFSYTATALRNGNLDLSWKKHLVSLNIKFLLGSVTLCPQSSATDHSVLLEYAIATITAQEGSINDSKTENDRYIAERQRALDRLEKCATLKEDIESDLYGKFKVVLNDKKSKIRQLIEQNNNLVKQVQEEKKKASTLNSKSQHKATPPISSEVTPPTQRDDPANQSNTDDEMESNPSTTPSPRPKPASTTTKKTTSRAVTTSLLGDPLKTISPPVKRRRREGVRKATGHPPEIPRPPAFTSRARSTSSGSSGQQQDDPAHKTSHDSLESDELLGLL